MTTGFVLSFFQDALRVGTILAMPALTLGLLIGLAVSVFQAVTQINEQTLALIPKVVVIILTLVLTGDWMLHTMIDWTVRVFGQISEFR